MIPKTTIKPTILEGMGTTKDAKYRIENYMLYAGASLTYGTIGNAYKCDRSGYVYAYSIEVYKRKAHKHKAHYKVFIYRISENWLYDNKKKLIQFRRYFRIVDWNKQVGKLSKY